MANHSGAFIQHELKQCETDDHILMTIMYYSAGKNEGIWPGTIK